MRLIGGGGGLSLDGALALTRGLDATLLFEVGLRDPFVYASVTGLIGVVALAACYLPAYRASRVDPVAALEEGA